MPWNSKTINNLSLQHWEKRRDRGEDTFFPLKILHDYVFDQENLAYVSFDAEFTNVTFNQCNLDGANFRSSILHSCKFVGGSMSLTSFRVTDFSTCSFVNAELNNILMSKYTCMPSEYSWMHTLCYSHIPRKEQVALWEEYPIHADVEDREDYVAMATLEYGTDL